MRPSVVSFELHKIAGGLYSQRRAVASTLVQTFLAFLGCKKRAPWYTWRYTVKTGWFRPRCKQRPALPFRRRRGRVCKSVIPSAGLGEKTRLPSPYSRMSERRPPCFNTRLAGPRREVKLPYRGINIACAHCRAPLTIGTAMDRILLSRRTCPKCGKEFVIENDVHEET